MILKKTQPKQFDKDKYYIDMNELQNKSRSRLYYVFMYVVEKELKWTDEQVQDALQEFATRKEFPALLKSMNEYVKDLVVFYYGEGDEATEYIHDVDPNKGTPKKKIVRKKRSKKKDTSTNTAATTQQAFEERMREQVRQDEERIANSKRKRKKGNRNAS